MKLRIGCGRSAIEVPNGTPLIGYETETPRLSTGTHDPLYAKAIMLEQNGQRYGLVCCDLLAADHNLIREILSETKDLGLCAERFMLSSTHTHSGPGGYYSKVAEGDESDKFHFSNIIPALVVSVKTAILTALHTAAETLENCSFSALASPAPGIGSDRNHPELPGDPMLTLLQFCTSSGKKILVYTTACHPTVLRADNTLCSADYPGVASAILEKSGVDFAMFLNGSAGDVSTRFTRKGVGFPEVERMGSLLAEQVLERKAQLPAPREDVVLENSSFTLPLKVRRLDLAQSEQELARFQKELAEAQARGIDGKELRMLQSRCEGALMAVLYARRQFNADDIPVTVRFWRIGDHVLGFFGVELFSALSNPVRAVFDQKFVSIGYSGAYLGYLTDPSVEHTDSYEKYSTVYQFTEGARLMAETKKHLEEHYGFLKNAE